jgi:hypothetical protein
MNEMRNPRTIYIFVTGGYDSIFRMCQLVMSHIPVQGIYLNLPNVDGTSYHRRNSKQEMSAMYSAVQELRRMGYGQYIYPIQVVTKLKLSNLVRNTCNKFYKSGIFPRPITQYVYMMELSLQMNKIIETGVLCDTNAVIYKTIGKYINPRTKIIDIDQVVAAGDFELLIFRNLKFPLCGTTKQKMLSYAKNNGFDHILKKTISCWFPRSSGKPCGTCNMCKERIIF